MQVLFLGGPWHGERHDVDPCQRRLGIEALPQRYSVLDVHSAGRPAGQGANARGGGRVVYTRRFAQSAGQRRAVYVAPDYQGPARA